MDRRSAIRTALGGLTRLSIPEGVSRPADAPTGGPKGARFRDAIQAYRRMLRAGLPTAIDAHTSASLNRWAVRWGSRPVRALRACEIRDYLRGLCRQGMSLDDVSKEKALLGAFYRWAMRREAVDDDPTQELVPGGGLTAWTATEQRRLLEACRGLRRASAGPGDARPAYLYPLVLLALKTGLRLKDLFRLEWSHVDLVTERIRMPSGDARGGKTFDIPIQRDPLSLLQALERRAATLPGRPTRVLEAAGLPLRQGRPDEHRVLADFRKARWAAGVPAGDFASLRVTFLRNCACAEIPMAHAGRLADWDDGDLLGRIYAERGRARWRWMAPGWRRRHGEAWNTAPAMSTLSPHEGN